MYGTTSASKAFRGHQRQSSPCPKLWESSLSVFMVVPSIDEPAITEKPENRSTTDSKRRRIIREREAATKRYCERGSMPSAGSPIPIRTQFPEKKTAVSLHFYCGNDRVSATSTRTAQNAVCACFPESRKEIRTEEKTPAYRNSRNPAHIKPLDFTYIASVPEQQSARCDLAMKS